MNGSKNLVYLMDNSIDRNSLFDNNLVIIKGHKAFTFSVAREKPFCFVLSLYVAMF